MSSRVLLLFMVLTFGLFAVEGAISVYLVEKEHYFVSEEIILKVDLKTTAFSIRDAKIGLENSKDTIVLTPKSAAFLETVEINDSNWQVVHYEYKLYPLHAGKIKIAPIEIKFTASMGYGQPENNFIFLSDELHLDIIAPKGIGEKEFVLSTPSYSLKSEISPQLSESNVTKIKIGDAIELKVIQEATNVPDILLKPLHFPENPHLKIYKEEPILKTTEQDSKTIATRIDAFTFVAIKEGNVSILSQTFIWWNPEQQVLHTQKTEALDFIVLANPKLATTLNASTKEQGKLWVWMIAIFLLFILALYILYPYLKRYRVRQKRSYMLSEEGRFKTVLTSAEGSDMAKLYHNFYYWLELADIKLARAGFKGIAKVQPSFTDALSALEEVLSLSEQQFDKKGFVKELKKFRELLLKQKQEKQQGLAENLNPL